MNITLSYIRSALLRCYPASEAAAISRIICCEMMGQNATDYYLGRDLMLTSSQKKELEETLMRLRNFEPIQYIQGTVSFLGHTLHIAPGALIPRPETEELAEIILKEMPPQARILDIGTGSGCLAVCLSKERPDAQVTAWDISEEALSVARANNTHLQTSVRFFQCDVLTHRTQPEEQYELIVSNPPYITEKEREKMQPNVLDWEPSQALFVPDTDPLLFYRHIALLGQKMLVTGGKLYFEINRIFGNDTTTLLRELNYTDIQLRKDLSGNDRFVIAKK